VRREEHSWEGVGGPPPPLPWLSLGNHRDLPAAAPLPEDIGGLLKRQVPRLAGDAATLVQQDDYVAARLGGAQEVGHEVASPSSVVWNHEPVPPPPALQLDSTSVQPGGHMVLFSERGRHSVHIVARWGLGAGLEH